jgi:Tfp pilus assembly protein FimV
LTIAPAQPLPATMAEAAPVVPPAPRAVVPPRTDSYDETLHTVKAGDTLATISQQYYLTEKYTQALLWYNHDQPMGAESRITEVNRLTPGQVLRVPPLRVLERKYPHTISGLANVAPASEVRPASVNPPSPNALPGLQAPPSGTYPLYRVRDPGELLADIAKHTLGASAQAERIRQLNPALAPQAPIPGRTILRLPGEARIDDADKP